MENKNNDFQAVMAAVCRGESLPPQWYFEQSVFDHEIEQVFRRTWQYIGPLSELKNPGDYMTACVGQVPVVVVRNEAGLAGFVNVCRHRRHQVMQGRGAASSMRCPYHAWTYSLDGSLKSAPRTECEHGFVRSNYPLLPVRVETLGPFAFVNLDDDAPALRQTYAGILEQIAESGIDLETMQLWQRDDWQENANWKTMLENYLECHHCAGSHPRFSALVDVRPDHLRLLAQRFVLSQRGERRPSALNDSRLVAVYQAQGEVAQAQYHLLWPNFTINISPGFPNMSVDVWSPSGPSATEGITEYYFAPGVTKTFAEQAIALNNHTIDEDVCLTESVQRSLRCGLPERAHLLPDVEVLIVEFQKRLVEALSSGADPRVAATGARRA